MKGWVGYGPKISTESEWTRWRKTAKPSKRCREWEQRKREKMDGWSEKRETGAAEVVNRSCGTHLFPLLILCDLYHTHRHTHLNTNSGTMCSVNTLEPTHKYAAKNQRQKITTVQLSKQKRHRFLVRFVYGDESVNRKTRWPETSWFTSFGFLY